MKKALVMILLCVCSISAFAQNNSANTADKYFKKLAKDPATTTIHISPAMFKMIAMFDNGPDSKETRQFMRSIDGLNIVSKENTAEAANLYKEALAYFTPGYDELMTVKEEDSDVKILVKENKKGNIAELVLLVSEDKEFTAICLKGDIDLAKLSAAGNIQIDGMDNLTKVCKKN